MIEKTRTTTFIIFVFRLIPLNLRRALLKAVFRLFYYASVRHRLITLHNLQNAYPDKPIDELEEIAKGVYRNLALVISEVFELPFIRRDTLHQWLDVDGLEHLERAYEKGKGYLSLVAHLGNWELIPVAAPMLSRPLQIVYRPLDSPLLDNLLGWIRTKHGNALIPKEGSGVRIICLLRKNWAIGILSDQNVDTHEGAFVDFFGRPACSSVGLAVLALHSGAPVIPVFMPRMPDGRYRLVIRPAVEITKTDDYEADLRVNTQRFMKIVEDFVRQYPDQWFWIHQRWKTRPCQGADRLQRSHRRKSGRVNMKTSEAKL
jgi:KDO2-lipid IV(A) lauroyltransferase